VVTPNCFLFPLVKVVIIAASFDFLGAKVNFRPLNIGGLWMIHLSGWGSIRWTLVPTVSLAEATHPSTPLNFGLPRVKSSGKYNVFCLRELRSVRGRRISVAFGRFSAAYVEAGSYNLIG
jgi:hypothetical protein